MPPSKPNIAAIAPICFLLVHWWLRDVWLCTLAAGKDLLKFPQISGAQTIAKRISPRQALENLQTLEQTQRMLHTNVQEALARWKSTEPAQIAFLIN